VAKTVTQSLQVDTVAALAAVGFALDCFITHDLKCRAVALLAMQAYDELVAAGYEVQRKPRLKFYNSTRGTADDRRRIFDIPEHWHHQIGGEG
jgi:hypothetical protein